MLDRMDAVAAQLEALLREVDAACATPSLAAAMVERSARVERQAAALRVMFAGRVAESNVWKDRGHRSPQHWLAEQSGSTVGAAGEALELSKTLRDAPRTEEALRAGELSLPQAAAVAKAAAVSPQAERDLLQTARREPLGRLRDESRKVVLAASGDDEQARYRRIHSERSFRTWTDDGGAFCFAGRGTPDVGAELLSALRGEREAIFAAARREGRRERDDAYDFDALVALVRRGGALTNGEGNGDGAAPAGRDLRKWGLRVEIDGLALARGVTEGDERCEIPGLGPVPVEFARRLLGEAMVEIVVTRGVDVTTVVLPGRKMCRELRVALEHRDQRCVVAGCTATRSLHNHHSDIPVAEGGDSRYDNLRRLCPHHHRLIHQGWRLERDGPDRYEIRPPGDPPDTG